MLSLHLYALVLWREITLWWKALRASGSLACPSYCWQFRDTERLSDASDTMDALHLSSSTIAAIFYINPTKFLCKMNPSFIHLYTHSHFFQLRKPYSLLIVYINYIYQNNWKKSIILIYTVLYTHSTHTSKLSVYVLSISST